MTSLFRFELQSCEAHLCIPMSVRLKSDCCGLKVTTQQWQSLRQEERYLFTALKVPVFPGLIKNMLDKTYGFG
jgi:hypothetical protein